MDEARPCRGLRLLSSRLGACALKLRGVMAQIIGGRYEVEQKLGRGAYGAVYRALDPRLGRRVAVKLLNESVSEDPAVRARFTREAKVMASLDHPAIVPVYDFGEEAGGFYLVMRHYAGGTLQGMLAARMADGRGPLPPAEVLALLEPLCGALDVAHEHGVVHRDLKPGNILLDERRHPAIADFGLARLLAEASTGGSLSATGSSLGTPHYMSPEQWEGDKDRVGGRSDLYSLGCIVYQLLVGQAPFVASSVPALMIRHLQAPPPKPSDARRDLPAPWDEAVAKLLAKARKTALPPRGSSSRGWSPRCNEAAATRMRRSCPQSLAGSTLRRPHRQRTPSAARRQFVSKLRRSLGKHCT